MDAPSRSTVGRSGPGLAVRNAGEPVPRTKNADLGGSAFVSGAGDGIRTRDIQHGKLMLYQLSYSRVSSPGGIPGERGALMLTPKRRQRDFGPRAAPEYLCWLTM